MLFCYGRSVLLKQFLDCTIAADVNNQIYRMIAPVAGNFPVQIGT